MLTEILADRLSDRFVAELIWERLGYKPTQPVSDIWLAGAKTPQYWSKSFPQGPEIIAQRKASIHLTRSISKSCKQLLKKKLDFPGYQIGELFPRRTRRATAVNWLLAWAKDKGRELPETGPSPDHLKAPNNPIKGHPGDPLIE